MPLSVGRPGAIPDGLTPADFAALFRLAPEEAVAYMERRASLAKTFDWRDAWQEEHLNQFTVSRLARLDLLEAIRDGITRSVEGDLSRRDFARDIKALLAEAGWWGEKVMVDPATGELVKTVFDPARLKLIYDTNVNMAYSAGTWERIQRNKATSPYLRYITKRDERVRITHQAWDNVSLPIGDPFWDTHFPPNGWRCRCRAMSMSQRDYDAWKAKGRIKTEAPPAETKRWVDKRSGEVHQVPIGIDPGFAYNPGKARVSEFAKMAKARIETLPAPLREAATAAVAVKPVSEAFRRAVDEALATLPDPVRAAVLAAGYEVRIAPALTDITPRLAGKTPRGHGAGVTWDHLDGATLPRQGLIAVAETARDIETGAAVPTGLERAAQLVRHEMAHAWDLSGKLSDQDRFVAAYERDAAALRPWLDRPEVLGAEASGQLSYMLQSGRAGRQEAFAEIFAYLHGGGTATHIDALSAFPEAAEVVRQLVSAQP